MGNNRFKLSDMMPNAWFYKLKDMGSTRTKNHKKKKQQLTSTTTTTMAHPQPPQPSLKPKHHPHYQNYPRKSYYFTRELIPTCHDQTNSHDSPINTKPTDNNIPHVDPPRKSSKKRSSRRRTTKSSSHSPKLVTSSVSAADCRCRATLWTKTASPPPDFFSASPSDDGGRSTHDEPEILLSPVLATADSSDNKESSRLSSSCGCKVDSQYSSDIVINVDKQSLANKIDKVYVFDNIPDLDLPPIITKSTVKFDDEVEDIKKQLQSKEAAAKHKSRSSAKYKETNVHGYSLPVKDVVNEQSIHCVKEHKTGSSVKRHSFVASPGVRLRVNSPRIGSRRIQSHHGRKSVSSITSSVSRRSLSDSLAIVKSSFDPQRDFKDSMMEMIVENNIKASKDLEDLLACYLSLNSDEYHDLIIKVFKQIWFDLTDIRFK